MDTIVQLVINALLASSLYALVAMGLTIILGVLDIADFAQGALYMLGAFVAFYATKLFTLSFFLALPLGFLVGGALGVANYLAVYRPLRRTSGATTFIAALGLLLILQNLALWIFGADFKLVPSPFGNARFTVLGASMGTYQTVPHLGRSLRGAGDVGVPATHTARKGLARRVAESQRRPDRRR